MKPYYEDTKSGITIFHGDCREILPSLPKVDLVLTDPPYGIGLECDYNRTRHQSAERRKQAGDKKVWRMIDHPRVYGDDTKFDPTFLLSFPRVALWGANNYADRLPAQYSWLVWDKKTDRGAKNNFTDCELCYCRGANFNSVRIFRHMWCGYQRDSEVGEGSFHPTQKPVALMRWVMGYFENVNLILDPFMGSGPVIKAAKEARKQAIGIEIEEKYCEIAVKRLAQEVLPLEHRQ